MDLLRLAADSFSRSLSCNARPSALVSFISKPWNFWYGENVAELGVRHPSEKAGERENEPADAGVDLPDSTLDRLDNTSRGPK